MDSRTSIASSMTFISSARAAMVASESAATCSQVVVVLAKSSSAVFNAVVVAFRSPSAFALVSSYAALLDFSASRSLVSAAIWSSKDCFTMAKLCLEVTSAFRKSLSSPSAFSFRSSRTSRMLELCVEYAAGSGAPSSESSEPCCDCTNASSFCLSELENAAASTTTLKDCIKPAMFFLSTWAKAVGFFCISLPRMVMALSRVSTTSTSSLSLAVNSATSASRISVAFVFSLSAAEIDPARSSIFELAASMAALASLM
mmetsp:Transcript_50112/g.108880  ORF Transcript_50112/g.108880 Transcript_50112/m.108880 type:complete len:258 (-) Transcript_50112:302-1075(-)